MAGSWMSTRCRCRPDAQDPALDACLLHCINHCSKTAELIKKNNQQVKADPDLEAPRDQGFTRPKVHATDYCIASPASLWLNPVVGLCSKAPIVFPVSQCVETLACGICVSFCNMLGVSVIEPGSCCRPCCSGPPSMMFSHIDGSKN